MLTADLRHALLAATRDAGYPAPGPDPVLRPGGAPGRYTSALPLRIDPGNPEPVAQAIAASLAGHPWIGAAHPTPRGYLEITVTGDALDRLAVRITEAGPQCARSDALSATEVAPPPAPRDRAWSHLHHQVLTQVTAALAVAAGAAVTFSVPGDRAPEPPVPPDLIVREAIAFAGPDAIRYTLARIPPESSASPDPAVAARHTEANPAYAVRYAYSCAASTLRWAADLGLSRGKAEQLSPGSLAHPRERALLDALSWLPEQVARAARRGRPHEFTAFLEELAETYQVCRVACPAWPEREPVVRARLWLAGAAAAALAAGLDLLGVGAPARL
jgi:DALR anticodon binding protein